METHSQREVPKMHEGKPLGRLGVIVAAVLFTLGLTAFAGQTVADSGGNGRGNGNATAMATATATARTGATGTAPQTAPSARS